MKYLWRDKFAGRDRVDRFAGPVAVAHKQLSEWVMIAIFTNEKIFFKYNKNKFLKYVI